MCSAFYLQVIRYGSVSKILKGAILRNLWTNYSVLISTTPYLVNTALYKSHYIAADKTISIHDKTVSYYSVTEPMYMGYSWNIFKIWKGSIKKLHIKRDKARKPPPPPGPNLLLQNRYKLLKKKYIYILFWRPSLSTFLLKNPSYGRHRISRPDADSITIAMKRKKT